MKKFGIICLIIISTIIICACNKEEIEENKMIIENTTYFRFSYSVGYYMNASYEYELELKDGKYIMSYKPDGISEEDKSIKEVNKDIVLEIEKILTKHDIYKWDGFDKVDKDVLDGNSFSLSYRKEDNETISASGYMMYPDGYREFRDEIHNYYVKLFE